MFKFKKVLIGVSIATSLFAGTIKQKQDFCTLINLQQTAFVTAVGGSTNSAFVVYTDNYEDPDIFYIKMRYSNGWDDIKDNAVMVGFKAIRIDTNRGSSKYYYFNK